MYYGLILVSVLMFSGCFQLNDIYRLMRGNDLRSCLQFSVFGGIAGLIVLFMINRCRTEATWFTLIVALLRSLVGLGFTVCALKALEVINLSLFSLFTMLGGMVLPFLQGILFYGEKMTAAKGACLFLILIALLLTVKKGRGKNGAIYYIGAFFLNGASGVLSKYFVSAPFEKTGPAGFSLLSALTTVCLSGAFLLLFLKPKDETPKMTLSAALVGLSAGGINNLANYLLVVPLAHVDASVQYPMVTGGVMIASTGIAFFGKTKPSKKEVLSVVVAFLGLLLLCVVRG